MFHFVPYCPGLVLCTVYRILILVKALSEVVNADSPVGSAGRQLEEVRVKLEAAGGPHLVPAQEALLVLDHVQLRPVAEHRVHHDVLCGGGPRGGDERPAVDGHSGHLGPQVEGWPDRDENIII